MAEAQTQAPKNQSPTPTEEDPEVQEPESQEPEEEEEEEGEDEETAQTNFVEIIDALMMGKGQLANLKQANNSQVLRQFLLNDLYPILLEMASHCNWYIGNLHDRVTYLEEEQGQGDGISPEFAAELMEFIGVTLQIFGELIPIIQTRPDMLHRVQILVAQAPSLMARIQDATMTDDEEEEEEEEEEEQEVPEVVEPASQKPAEVSQTPEPPAVEPQSEPKPPEEAPQVSAPEPEPEPEPAEPQPEEVAESVESIPVEEVVKTPEAEPQSEETPEEKKEESNA